MLECLVVTETVPQRLLELGHGREESIVSGASPEHLPEPLDHLQLGTIAGEWVQLQMREGPKHCCDDGASVPGGFVDHDHDAGILRSGVGPCDVAQMASKRLLCFMWCLLGVCAGLPAFRSMGTGRLPCADGLSTGSSGGHP